MLFFDDDNDDEKQQQQTPEQHTHKMSWKWHFDLQKNNKIHNILGKTKPKQKSLENCWFSLIFRLFVCLDLKKKKMSNEK